MKLQSYAAGKWYEAPGGFVDLPSAVDGHTVAQASSQGLDFGAMVRYARETGGPALRALTFHQRAAMLKELALYLSDRKDPLYQHIRQVRQQNISNIKTARPA